MGRQKNGSIIYQLTERLKGLQRFGQSKHQAKMEYREEQVAKGEKFNPAYAKGIFSYNTYNSYKQTALQFVNWLKSEHSGLKNLDNISKDNAIQYLQNRQAEGKSAYTVSKDMAALNKVFNTEICKKDAGLNTRSYKDVTRSRGDKPNDKKYNPKNYSEQINFAQATGCRRASIVGGQYQVKPCSLWKDPKDNLFVSLVEKGGKFRNAPVLGDYKDSIEKMVPNIPVRTASANIDKEANQFKEMYRESEDEPLFSKYTTKIDNHAFRAQYARDRYQELVQQKQEQGREIVLDSRGFDKECVGQVSADLGHNRLSVVVEHYMR